MKNERISIFRLIPILVIFGVTAAYSCLLGFINQIYMDQGICILFIDMVFLFFLVFALEFQRKRKLLSNNRTTHYIRLMAGYIAACIIIFAYSFLMDFSLPMVLLVMLLYSVSNETLSLSINLFLCTIFELCKSNSLYELLCFISLTVLAIFIAKAWEEKDMQKYLLILILCIQVVFPGIFYYLENQATSIEVFIIGIINGCIALLFAKFIYPKLFQETQSELSDKLWDMIAESNPEVMNLKSFSPADYNHARIVSEIAIKYARELKYPISLCGAGGFYYRMGKWQGGDYMKNGIDKAISLDFPIELIEIIEEYYGEEKLPSTPISAMIHMIDAAALRVEALQKDAGKSNWNREMIIYQTLNEYSTQGIYDESGLSMNQFLKIRELLVKEVLIS